MSPQASTTSRLSCFNKSRGGGGGDGSWASAPSTSNWSSPPSTLDWSSAPSISKSSLDWSSSPSSSESSLDWSSAPSFFDWSARSFESNGASRVNTMSGHGAWQNGKHIVCDRNMRLERKLFGDLSKQRTVTNFDKYDNIPVEVTGTGVPEPVLSFTNSPLDPVLLENIGFAMYTIPTPVQRYSIPIVANGRDLMVCAQAGSGKTAGFLFPILSALFAAGPRPPVEQVSSYPRARKAYPTALILAPTRELVSQIHEEALKFTYRSWVRPAVVYGGVDIHQQLSSIKKGCDLLSATPGRLVDLIKRGRISFANIKYLVLAEADHMLDMGFKRQIQRIVQDEDMPGVQDRQTLMFSVTCSHNIGIFARDFLKDYIFLSVGRVGSTFENITQKIEYVEDSDKRSALLDLLFAQNQGKLGLMLVFVETKRMADRVTDFLTANHLPATSIHGDRTQRERESTLKTFQTGRTPILVATATTVRGLNIPNITHVINYDLPSNIDGYVRRIGHIGRTDNTSVSTTFFNRGDKNISRALLELLWEANQDIPAWLESMIKEPSCGGSSCGRGGDGGRGGSSNGGRDHRTGGGSGCGYYRDSSMAQLLPAQLRRFDCLPPSSSWD